MGESCVGQLVGRLAQLVANSVMCARVCESVCICVGVCAYGRSVIKVKNYEPAKNSDSCYTKQKKSLKRTEGSVRARH